MRLVFDVLTAVNLNGASSGWMQSGYQVPLTTVDAAMSLPIEFRRTTSGLDLHWTSAGDRFISVPFGGEVRLQLTSVRFELRSCGTIAVFRETFERQLTGVTGTIGRTDENSVSVPSPVLSRRKHLFYKKIKGCLKLTVSNRCDPLIVHGSLVRDVELADGEETAIWGTGITFYR